MKNNFNDNKNVCNRHQLPLECELCELKVVRIWAKFPNNKSDFETGFMTNFLVQVWSLDYHKKNALKIFNIGLQEPELWII